MIQVDREKILEAITKKVTRDDGEIFTDTTRLDYIKSRLEESDYEILLEMPLSVIYKKKNVELPEKIVLISSHVDCVDGIQKPDFKITPKGNYKGTFDNAATNAAIVIAMLENKLAENIVIAFTGDEEVDSRGAKQVIGLLGKNQKKVIAISLDVTFDLESEEDDKMTTYDYASYTIDNLCKNTKKSIAKLLFDIANELKIPYMVTRADEEDYFDYIEDKVSCYYRKKFEVKGVAFEDEAIKYSKSKCCIGAFSLCLPTNDPSDDDEEEDEWYMHTDKLVKIKKKSFNEYIEAVTQISTRMAE